MNPHEALNQMLELICYHAPPEEWWRAEAWARTIREALREGERAKAALEAATARERSLRAAEERMRKALAIIELEASRARQG